MTVAAELDRRPPDTGGRRGWLAAGTIVAVLALAGLVYSFVPQHAGPAIRVSGQYVREPASSDVAAAYLTVHNNSANAVTLTSTRTDVEASGQVMTEDPGGTMTDTTLIVAAHSSATLRPNGRHLMLEHPTTLTKGQTVQLWMTFSDGTQVHVTAPVIGVLEPAPHG